MVTHTVFPNKCLTIRTDARWEAEVTFTFCVAPGRVDTLDGLPNSGRTSGLDSICPCPPML